MNAEELDLSKVKAGDYELVIHAWDEIVSKPGQPFDFVPHRQGDTVTLDIEQARRLLVAGAVKPKGKKAEKDDTRTNGGGSGDGANKPTAVKDILAEVGEDKAKAAEYLEAENAAEKPRKSLVEGLQAVIDAEPQA